jgi:hypothetical protein
MEERWRLVLWAFLGGGFGMLAGSLFGALACMLARRAGNRAGSFIGRHAAAFFTRFRDEPLSDRADALLTGAGDGGFFLGLIGLLAGGGAGWSGRVDLSTAAAICFAILLLLIVAAILGSIAHGLVRVGTGVLGAPCLGSLFGATVGGQSEGAWGTMLGALIGAAIGLLVVAACLLTDPDRKTERESNRH